MKRIRTSESFILILERGEELHSTLEKFARENELSGAWISGLGATDDLAIGLYNFEDREYVWKEYKEPLEILNLTGNLSIVEEESVWHIHGTFSNKELSAIGGHVKRLVVSVTCELHITPTDSSLTRRLDEETGLKLLDEK
ncbi:MAG: DUF296 domain-containing protein [Candidatus Campbellbacteria bacterium]|nr:DUF296 domain-containing protein [Candidatus Campbellbacteria bacterium]